MHDYACQEGIYIGCRYEDVVKGTGIGCSRNDASEARIYGAAISAFHTERLGVSFMEKLIIVYIPFTEAAFQIRYNAF